MTQFIEYTLYSRKLITTAGEYSFFGSIAGNTNIKKPNSIPSNWIKFEIMLMKVYVDIPFTYSLKFIESYFSFILSQNTLINIHMLEALNAPFCLEHTNMSPIKFISQSFDNFYKFEPPIVIKPDMSFDVKLNTNVNLFTNVVVALKGIVERKIIG